MRPDALGSRGRPGCNAPDLSEVSSILNQPSASPAFRQSADSAFAASVGNKASTILVPTLSKTALTTELTMPRRPPAVPPPRNVTRNRKPAARTDRPRRGPISTSGAWKVSAPEGCLIASAYVSVEFRHDRNIDHRDASRPSCCSWRCLDYLLNADLGGQEAGWNDFHSGPGTEAGGGSATGPATTAEDGPFVRVVQFY